MYLFTNLILHGLEAENLKKGDTVEFEVIELDLDEKKIKGSIKALEKSPWEKKLWKFIKLEM